MNTIPSPIHGAPRGEPRVLETTPGIPHQNGPERLNQTTVTRDQLRLDVRATERASYTEYHITGTVVGPMEAGAAADELLAQVAAVVAERGIQPIQEKLYGLSGVRAEVLKRREIQYRRQELDLSMQVTWIVGTPLLGCGFVGVQIWGIVPRAAGVGVRTVENPVTGRGRLLTGRGFRMLHIPFVRGLKPGGALAGDAPAQADQMFTNVGLGLKAHGMEYRNVVRTWIYMARLLEWYGDFNRVRTAHYQPAGLGVPGGVAFPASTGIQGRYADEECLMDVLAFEADGPGAAAAIPINHSPRQDRSFNYGSAFSRGMTLAIEGKRTVYISGTSSVNPAGDSIHVGDAELQSLETLMCIAAILEEQGGSLENITSATLFCKNREAWETWTRVSRLLRVPAFPKVCVLADVCRHDLLVEMEVVATI